MKIKEILTKLKEKKYFLILLIIGIVIMLIPGKDEKNTTDNRIYSDCVNKIEVEKLERVLKKINGVKSCDIFVTYDNNGENNFAYDISSGNNKQIEIKVNDDEPLLKSVYNPKARGIFALVEGKINKNEVVKIIKAATGIPMHRIYVKISGEE